MKRSSEDIIYLAAHLAEGDQALGGGQVFVLDAHASVLRGEAEEAPNAKHKRDVEAGDAKAGQRLPYYPPLHPLQHRNHPGPIIGVC